MNHRITKGKGVILEAINTGDAILLKRCLTTFVEMGAPIADIADAIAGCPLSLLEEAGICLVIESAVAARRLVLGRDISWAAVKGLLHERADKAVVRTVVEAQGIFGGEIVTATPCNQTQLFS
ncbi:MAG: hypothetical protein C0402_05325 [Thermodesulfovibrio sp.]|nr:hypothetical protein [Thermodesulfovibrio sp.]